MVTDYADGITLCEHLQKHFSELTWKDKYKLALGVTDGLMYLHKLNIVHKGLVCIDNIHDGHIVIVES